MTEWSLLWKYLRLIAQKKILSEHHGSCDILLKKNNWFRSLYLFLLPQLEQFIKFLLLLQAFWLRERNQRKPFSNDKQKDALETMIEQFWLVLSGCFNLLHKEVTLPICACCFSKPLLCPVLGNGERFWKEQSHTSSKHTIPVQPRWMPGIPTSSIPVLLETAWSNSLNTSGQLRLGMESLKVHQELGMMEKCSAMQAWQVSPDWTCL